MSSTAEPRHWWRRVDLRLALFVGACAALLNALAVAALTSFAIFEALEVEAYALDTAARRIAGEARSSTAGVDGAIRWRVAGMGDPDHDPPLKSGRQRADVSIWTALMSAPGDTLMRQVQRPDGALLEASLPLRHFVGERRELLANAALVVALSSLASIGFGVFAARRALAPVRAMAGAMREIAPSALDARMPMRWSGDDVDALAGSINEVLARLEWAFGRLSGFSADVAHELRNGVNRILNETELVLLNGKDAGAGDAIAAVHAAAEEMRDVVERLLLLAKGEEGRLALGSQAVDLRDLCARMVEFYHPLADTLGTVLCVRGPAGEVRGDHRLLEAAVSNLIENALRHGASGGAIEVVTEVDSDGVRIGVLDGGPGVPPADRERIFERFVRLGTARGAGLGLPLARMIARVHGGELTVDASPLGGAAFWLSLPRLRS